MCIEHNKIITGSLVTITSLSFAALTLPSVLADDGFVDVITINVPVSCSLVASGMNTHTATIQNGNTTSDIGTTNVKVTCNDNTGYALYAIGYTNDEYGNNKLTNATLGSTHDIITATTVTTGTSSWAMKLAKTGSTYLPIIAGSTDDTNKQTGDPDFSGYTAVPNEYTKVAYFPSSTDIGSGASGSNLTTTYRAYISQTQPAGTYIGQVKYTLVHPNTAPAPVAEGKVGVTYNANSSSFTGGATTNRVVYASSPMYIATTPTVVETSNLTNGVQSGSYADDEHVLETKSFAGASKVKVVLDYGLTHQADITVVEGAWGGRDDGSPAGNYYYYYTDGGNITGSETFVMNGNTVTVEMYGYNTAVSGYDYGMYARLYPIYTTEQTGTESSSEFVTISTDTGTYAQTTDWYGSWYATINNQHYDFVSEADLKNFMADNIAMLSGTNIDLYRGLTFAEAYTRAGKSQDGGYYKQQDLNGNMCQTVAVTQTQTTKDTRDNNTYMIGKLKDGNCWMLDNLRLDPTDATTAANMNANNTNATSEAITNYLNGGSNNTGWSSSAVVNSTSNFYNGGFTVPRINNQSKDTLVDSFGLAAMNGQAKVGIYYNYCAATVGTYCYADMSNTIIDASQDICPAGWRMPTAGPSGEYLALYKQYNTVQTATDSASLQYNLSTSLSGYFSSMALNQGSSAYWWSSTYRNGGSMYKLYVDSTYVDSAYYGSRDDGCSVRCILGS